MIVFFEILVIIVIAMLVYSMIKSYFFKSNNIASLINDSNVSKEQWDDAFKSLPLLKGFSDQENKDLKTLSILFMDDKLFEGAQGFEITTRVMLIISLQACLPILKLGLDCYKNFSTIIVYPSGFKTNRKVTDENGIVDHDKTHTLGEAWLGGPVILSWTDTEKAGELDGSNLVIHEFAHKLDMQNGVANGFPPLQSGMKLDDWVTEFSKAFDYFERKCKGHELRDISCYAATSPAEFFSVFSEVFFEQPKIIQKHFPQVHTLLELYYCQSPISRLSNK